MLYTSVAVPRAPRAHGSKKRALRWKDTLKPVSFLPLHTVSFLELIDTTTGIHQLLLAREERMAIAANIHFHDVPLFGGARLEGSSARTDYCYFVIFGMYISFHSYHLAVSCAFHFRCFPIITLFFSAVNCFCVNLQKIVAKLPEMRYTDFEKSFCRSVKR